MTATQTLQPDKIHESLLTTADLILEEIRAIDPGALGEVYAMHSNGIRAVFENTDFSMTTDSTTTLYGIRVITGGRLGFVTTNSLDNAELRKAAREAFALAKLSPPSEFHVLAEPGPDNGQHFAFVDPALLELDIAATTDWTDRIIRRAKSDPRVAIDRAEFGRSFGAAAIANTGGVRFSRAKTLADWYVMGMARDGEEVTSFDFDGGSVGKIGRIESRLDESVDRFSTSVLASLGGGAAESYQGRVLLHPRAVADLLGGTVGANCNGRQHQDGISAWKDKFGEIVAAEALTISEDPLDLERPQGWRPFDREGVATGARDLLRSGRLAHIGHDCFSARRGATAPTGNASGSARGLPGIGFGPLTVELAGASGGDDDIFSDFGAGLVLKRFSGNRDAVSGRFSGVAKNGFLIENGRQGRPVREVMIAGNLFEVLKNIRAASGQMHELPGGSRAPYMIVDGLSVTAG